MKKSIQRNLDYLKNKIHVDQTTLKKFEQRLNSGLGILKSDCLEDHFCVFFVPIHCGSKSVYLGNHIKAGDWVPPGGHIEHRDKNTINTVKREFLEELDYKINNNMLELFNVSIKNINKPEYKCKKHWDLWYLVYFQNKPVFEFLKKEYYEARWFPINKGISTIKHNPNVAEILSKVKQFIF